MPITHTGPFRLAPGHPRTWSLRSACSTRVRTWPCRIIDTLNKQIWLTSSEFATVLPFQLPCASDAATDTVLSDPPHDCKPTDPSLPDPASHAHTLLSALVDLDLQATATLFPIILVGVCFATSTTCSQGHDHGEFADY